MCTISTKSISKKLHIIPYWVRKNLTVKFSQIYLRKVKPNLLVTCESIHIIMLNQYPEIHLNGLGFLFIKIFYGSQLKIHWICAKISSSIIQLFLPVGRGVLLSSTYHSSSVDTSYLLCVTYKAALSAGFDWLEYSGKNYIKAAVGNEGKTSVCYIRVF